MSIQCAARLARASTPHKTYARIRPAQLKQAVAFYEGRRYS